MIHKEGTDQSEIQNYRSILLLNVDYKMFASILAQFEKSFGADHSSGPVRILTKKTNEKQYQDNIECLGIL